MRWIDDVVIRVRLRVEGPGVWCGWSTTWSSGFDCAWRGQARKNPRPTQDHQFGAWFGVVGNAYQFGAWMERYARRRITDTGVTIRCRLWLIRTPVIPFSGMSFPAMVVIGTPFTLTFAVLPLTSILIP